MADWAAHFKDIVRSIFEEYAVNIVVLLLAWPLLYLAITKAPYLNALDFELRVYGDSGIPAAALVSLAVTWLLQMWVSSIVSALTAAVKRMRESKHQLADILADEAAFLCGLYSNRVESISLADPNQARAIADLAGALFESEKDLFRAIRRIRGCDFASENFGFNLRERTLAIHLYQIERHLKALKKRAGKRLDDIEHLIPRDGQG